VKRVAFTGQRVKRLFLQDKGYDYKKCDELEDNASTKPGVCLRRKVYFFKMLIRATHIGRH